MNKVSVIIPNWNGFDLLKDCLTSLRRQTFINFEVVVVDNNSTDNSIEFIKNNFPKTKIIKLNKNYGFARATNEGVRASKSPYVVFLNNDTSVDKNFLKELVSTADKNSKVISVNSKILNFDDRKLIDGVGIKINEVGQAPSIGWNQKDEGQFKGEMEIFGATAGASLFRREDFIKLGMFDENYFMYSEEVDFAFRAQFLGYKSLYSPKAVVYHKHKATSKKMPQHLEFWQFRNMTQTIIKNFPQEIISKNWRWLKIILVHLNTIFYQLRNGYFWPPIMVELWLTINLPRLLKERTRIQKLRKVPIEYIESFLEKKEITLWGLKEKNKLR